MKRVAKNVGEAAGHSGTKIHSGWAEDHDDAGGHVFAAVMADAFDDRERAAIAYGEAFADSSGDEKFSAGGAVEHGVAGENVTALRCRGSGADGDSAAAEAFADVIVGIAEQFEAQAGDQKCAETLSSGAAKFALDGLAGQTVEIRAAENVAAEMRADAAVGVADG